MSTNDMRGALFMHYERLVKEYLLELKLENYSKRTIESYEQHHRKFVNYYRKEISSPILIEDVKKIHYKLFISYLLDCQLKSSYINTILKTHKAFWNYLVAEKVVKVSPLDTIRLLKETKPLLTTFSDKEVKNMLNVWKFDTYLGARNKCIIALLADTGIRVSELLNLKDTDLAENYIRILGKGNKWRVVPISSELNYFITRYRRIRDKHFYTLRNYHGRTRKIDEQLILGKTGRKIKTVTTIELILKETGKRAGIRKTVRCSPHTLRHYWTVKNLQMGQDIFTISKMLGHSKLDTTKIYINSITDEQLVDKAVKTSPLSNLF
ncbi:TPA: tyrosine-type recombinase/integrase [Enterococcus faecalis]|nr:integrase [Enterococcus faecalis]HAP3815283.1 tyrosine-type recombinase/integrase [Enterococcus faecalis]